MPHFNAHSIKYYSLKGVLNSQAADKTLLDYSPNYFITMDFNQCTLSQSPSVLRTEHSLEK